jgi:hypothetical protein
MGLLERIVMGACCGTAFDQVTKLMDVETVLLIWGQASEISSDGCAAEVVFLFKVDHTFACLIGFRMHDADRTTGFIGCVIRVGNRFV